MFLFVLVSLFWHYAKIVSPHLPTPHRVGRKQRKKRKKITFSRSNTLFALVLPAFFFFLLSLPCIYIYHSLYVVWFCVGLLYKYTATLSSVIMASSSNETFSFSNFRVYEIFCKPILLPTWSIYRSIFCTLYVSMVKTQQHSTLINTPEN